ncbi:MAG: NAD(P)-dependent alcohol dehydrogenase [Sphingomonas fennica]
MEIAAAVSRAGAATPLPETIVQEAPRPGEMRVRIVAAGICHTDVHAHAGGRSPLPIVLGHEGAGVVEALGEGVRGFSVGDHVVLSGSSCGACRGCTTGQPTYCDDAMALSFGGQRPDGSTALAGRDGERIHSHFFGQSSFATHAIVPERTAVKVPSDVPLEKLGVLGCGVITGAGAVIEALRVRAGQTIAIFGTGGVGLSAVMAAKLVGARRIVAIDLNPERLALARELGATDTLPGDAPDLAAAVRAIGGNGIDFSLNTTTVASAHAAGLDCLAMHGTAGFVSAPRGDWAPAMLPLLAGGRTLTGILGGSADPQRFVPMLIDYWRQGRFPFDRLLSFYPFADIATAFADAAAGRAIKPVLLMPGMAA